MSSTNDPIAMSLHGERMVEAGERKDTSGAEGELSEMLELEDLQRGSTFFDENPARALPEFRQEGKQSESLI
jgi:hypothetical protein